MDKLLNAVATRIEDKMMELEQDPRPPGCKKLKGRPGYRVRIGDYRVIYNIEDNILTVFVLTIGHRRDVYD
ncbi:type II toxin-antitoxin system RelE family toxin [Flavitalea flava]